MSWTDFKPSSTESDVTGKAYTCRLVWGTKDKSVWEGFFLEPPCRDLVKAALQREIEKSSNLFSFERRVPEVNRRIEAIELIDNITIPSVTHMKPFVWGMEKYTAKDADVQERTTLKVAGVEIGHCIVRPLAIYSAHE